ncbi:hypothetical protein [Bradyrhizobium sp. HKCCYLRH1030]|uniref:hypothetical protein n=1 Tax=Bradyrhizobium sp. HKCCYLRH1030 TaxID=3420744 RepID=UPI003EBD4E31
MSPESDNSSPPPEKMFDPTSLDELLELTAFLQADEAARRAFERIGIHGDFTARAFLEDRFFQRAGDRSGILTRKARAEEVMWMARDLMANSAYWGIIKEVIKKGEFAGVDDDLLRDVVTPLEDAITVKYGLINRGYLGAHSLLRAIAMGKIDSLDSPEAWQSVRARKMFVQD